MGRESLKGDLVIGAGEDYKRGLQVYLYQGKTQETPYLLFGDDVGKTLNEFLCRKGIDFGSECVPGNGSFPLVKDKDYEVVGAVQGRMDSREVVEITPRSEGPYAEILGERGTCLNREHLGKMRERGVSLLEESI